MPTAATAASLTTAYANICSLIATVTANPKPSYSVDGRSFSWESYLAMLIAQQKALLQSMQMDAGPFTVVG